MIFFCGDPQGNFDHLIKAIHRSLSVGAWSIDRIILFFKIVPRLR